MIWLPGGGAKAPSSDGTIARGEHHIRMEGKETYRFATRTLASTALAAVEKAGLTAADIDLFIPHQANIRIIEAVAKGLDLPMERMFVNLDRYGNTSAASIPIALAEAVDSGRVKIGDHIVIVAFGAGFTSGAVAIEWTADPARAIGVDERVRPEDVHIRPPLDWNSVDPIPPALAALMATPVAGHALDLDDVVPGEPGPRQPRGGPGVIDLSGKSAIVTGGSRGIGRAIVLRLATQGADVAFSYRGNEAAAKETAAAVEALGRRALAVQGDVSDPAAAEAVVAAGLAAFGGSTSSSTTPASPATTSSCG